MPDETAPTLTIQIDADTRALQEQLTECARLGARFGNALSQSLVDATLRGKGLTDVMRSLALRLSEIALKAAFKPLTEALGGGLAGLVSGIAFARGGVVRGGLPVPFAQGGVISSPIAFPLDNNRFGVAGERGAEAILPLARGPDGRLGVRVGSRRRRPRHLQHRHARRRQLPAVRDADRRHAGPRRRPRPPQFVIALALVGRG